MIKGISKQVIVVHSPDPKLFEQAIFILKEGVSGISNDALLKELNLPEGMVPCCAIILGQTDEKYELRNIPEKKIKTDFIK